MALLGAVVTAWARRDTPPDPDRLIRHPWVLVIVAAWLVFAVVRIGVDLAA